MKKSFKGMIYQGAKLVMYFFLLASTRTTLASPLAHKCAGRWPESAALEPALPAPPSMHPRPRLAMQPPLFDVSYPHRQTGEITFFANPSNTLIHVASEFGIGSAAIQLTQGQWPESIAVRLYLQGLEGFTVTSGTTTIEKSQLNVQAYDRNMNPFHQKYLLSEAGYYEIRLPESLFTDGTTAIRIQWVDFYRH